MSLVITSDFGPWKETCADTARHATAVLRLAGKDNIPANVAALIESTPHDDAELRDPEFRHRSFCRECLDLACDWVAYHGKPEDQVAYDAAERHFLVTVPAFEKGKRKLLEDSFCGILQGLGLRSLQRGEGHDS